MVMRFGSLNGNRPEKIRRVLLDGNGKVVQHGDWEHIEWLDDYEDGSNDEF